MLCNLAGQPPQACKCSSSKHTRQKQQQQQQPQQHAQDRHMSSMSPIAANSKQSCSSIQLGSCTTRLNRTAGLLTWLGVALLLVLATPSHAQSQSTCPVSIDYAVSLGQGGGDNSDVPVFVGSVGITNNANVRVTPAASSTQHTALASFNN